LPLRPPRGARRLSPSRRADREGRRGGQGRVPAQEGRAVVSGRFPLLTDENISGPVIEGLRARGWDVVRTIDVFGERSVDEVIFAYAVEKGRVLASSDTDCLAIGQRWLEQGRAFRMVYWHQGRHQGVRVSAFLDAFDALAAEPNAFAACIEYLKID